MAVLTFAAPETAAPAQAVGRPVQSEAEQKRRFALEWTRTPQDAYGAMRRVFPGDPGGNIFRVVSWQHDEEVQGYVAELTQSRPESDLMPTKERTCRWLYDTCTNLEQRMEMKDRLRGIELFARIQGWFEGEAPGVTVNNVVNKVMVVRDHGTDDDWEEKARRQQAALIIDAQPSNAT